MRRSVATIVNCRVVYFIDRWVERQQMDQQGVIERAHALRALHDRRHVLLLPNAWDAGSAALLASLGFPAIATTSGGVAWSLGYADGGHLPFAEVIAAIERITRVVSIPVTVDFEDGYGATPAAVGEHVRRAIDAGVAGLNIEDGIRHQSLRTQDDGTARIAAARKAAADAGVPIFINARVDVFAVPGSASTAERIEATVRRAQAYLAAGADGIYPMGVADPDVIKALCARIDAPINVMARDGLPDLAALAKLGVARVTTATHLATRAYATARDSALQLRASGHFSGLAASLNYGELQHLFPVSATRTPQ